MMRLTDSGGRFEPSSEELWIEARAWVSLTRGILVVDDTTLDKWYASKVELVTKHWSGKHGRVVQGINLTTLLWSDGDKHIPCDYRLDEKSQDGQTKNDHFRAMLNQASDRGMKPEGVVFAILVRQLGKSKTDSLLQVDLANSAKSVTVMLILMGR